MLAVSTPLSDIQLTVNNCNQESSKKLSRAKCLIISFSALYHNKEKSSTQYGDLFGIAQLWLQQIYSRLHHHLKHHVHHCCETNIF